MFYFNQFKNSLEIHRRNKQKNIFLCNLGNVKFQWDLKEAKESIKFNKKCVLIFDRVEKDAHLICTVNVDSKVLLLNLIFKQLMSCEDKISLTNIKEVRSQQNALINSISASKKIGKSVLYHDESDPGDFGNHYLYFTRYTLYKLAGSVYRRKKGDLGVKMQNFERVNLMISDYDVNFYRIYEEDDYKNFSKNTNKAGHHPEQNEVHLTFESIFCKELKQDLLYLSKAVARNRLLSEVVINLPDDIFRGMCWAVSGCKSDTEYILCFDKEDDYVNFKTMFVNAAILYNFMHRWEKYFDEANQKRFLNEKIDRFVHQNMANSRFEMNKSADELKKWPDYDNVYKTHKGLFKKPAKSSKKLNALKETAEFYKRKKREKYVKNFCNKVKGLKQGDQNKAETLLKKFDLKTFNLADEKIKRQAGLID